MEIDKSLRGARKTMPMKRRFVPSRADTRGCQPFARLVGCRREIVNHPSSTRNDRAHDFENSRARSRESSAAKLFAANRLYAVAVARKKNQRLTVNRTTRSQVKIAPISTSGRRDDDEMRKRRDDDEEQNPAAGNRDTVGAHSATREATHPAPFKPSRDADRAQQIDGQSQGEPGKTDEHDQRHQQKRASQKRNRRKQLRVAAGNDIQGEEPHASDEHCDTGDDMPKKRIRRYRGDRADKKQADQNEREGVRNAKGHRVRNRRPDHHATDHGGEQHVHHGLAGASSFLDETPRSGLPEVSTPSVLSADSCSMFFEVTVAKLGLLSIARAK